MSEARNISVPERSASGLGLVRRSVWGYMALMCLAQLAAAKTTFLIGGVLILEKVLGIQGIGLMGYQAAVQPDFQLLIAITVLATGLVAGMHLGVDVLRVVVDPRVRKERRAPARVGATA